MTGRGESYRVISWMYRRGGRRPPKKIFLGGSENVKSLNGPSKFFKMILGKYKYMFLSNL